MIVSRAHVRYRRSLRCGDRGGRRRSKAKVRWGWIVDGGLWILDTVSHCRL
jgi:hypothetical protein